MRRPQRAYSSGQDNDQVLDEPVPDDHVVTVDEHHDASAKRLHYLDTSVRLYQAALKGDWQVAKILIEKYPDLVRRPITEQKDTALHIAVAAKHATFAKELVKCMTWEDIELQNENGNTALCFAAYAGGSELVSIVQEMVQENKKLPLVRGSCGNTPLYIAALNGSKEMVSYLYPLTPFEDLAPIDRIDILVATISTDMYDIALTILKKDPTLATMKNSTNRIALQELASKPLAFDIRSQLLVWERCFNSWFKGMCNKALIHTPAHELVKLLWKEVLALPTDKFAELFDRHSSFLFKAAKFGNVEYLIILIRSYPDLIWKVDKKHRSIFHIAVKYRQENVFNLIYEIGAIKYIIAKYIDLDTKNNMLHLAGQLAPLDRLNTISAAFLQMERELLWFKEIENIVPPSYRKMKNIDQKGQPRVENQDRQGVDTPSDMKMVNVDQKYYGNKDQYFEVGDTPWDLFSKEHKELKAQGEKWMKDTSNNCMLVAALIATVVFAATYTVPGGSDQTGIPMFLNDNWFTVFCVSDALALVSSSISLLTFLSIAITSGYAEQDFLKSLPIKLLFALATLCISIASMVVAFCASYFLFYFLDMTWVPPVILASASMPVALFVVQNYKLWVDIFRSTHRSRILFRPDKRMLF